MNFERFFYETLATIVRYIESRPLNLGGSAGPAGGDSGRPGGFIGYLPQTRVAYDEDEFALNTTSGIPSLLDNLNHIRYRINNLETSITISGLEIKKNNKIIANNIRTIDFQGGVIVEKEGETEVNVFITLSGFQDSVFIPSGVYNVNLSSQITGSNNTFTINDAFIPQSLQVFINGINQKDFTPTSNGFQLDFNPSTSDILTVNYDKLVGVPAALNLSHSTLSDLTNDDHPQYLNAERAHEYFYLKEEVDLLISPIYVLSGLLPPTPGNLIVGTTNYRFEKLSPPPSGGLVLISDLGQPELMRWGTIPEPEEVRKTIYQQIVFTIAGANLGETGIKPLRIYTNYLGYNSQIIEILCYVDTSPALNNLRLGIYKNGTNILSSPNYIEIPVGQKTKLINTGFNNSINYNDYFQIGIIQGDYFAKDLTVHIRYSTEV
jgi:hypothetical protein